MTQEPLLCAVAADDSARDVIDTGTALAEAAGLVPVFAHVATVEFAATSSVIPVGAAAGWAPFPAGGFHQAERRARERASDLLSGLGLSESQIRVATGSPTAELQAIASGIGAEAIVVGGRPGGGVKALTMGSVPRWLTVNGDRPIVFARERPEIRPAMGPIICGLDPAAGDALHVARTASRFAALLDRRLVLVHVGNFGVGEEAEVIGYESLLEGNRRSALRRMHRLVDELPGDVPVEVVLESGWEPHRLVAQADARSAALIVVGNRGRGPIRSALVGSISLELANSARQVVVVVPPEA